MNDIYNIASRLDILAQRTDELARDIRLLSNDIRQFHESGKLD
jgi:hypothetical protein